MQGFALYHKALAMALSGDFEGADKILSGPDLGQVRETRRAVLARVQVLAQLDRRADALAALNLAFPPGKDATMDALRAALQGSAPVPFTIVTSPRDGLAEVLFDMAIALSGQADDGYVLLFARTAAALRPDHVEATMLAAQLLQRLGQSDLAAEVYALIPASNPAFLDAEIGRANAATQAGQGDQAVTILTGLQQAHPDDPGVIQSLADTLRRLGRFAEAIPQYDSAIRLVGTPKAGDWPLFYARAISQSELNHWPEAEADFRKALELNPNQPQVLNEALKMIQRAVLLAPDQGYIVDSLAWALYRLGRAPEAVVPMERASLLMPVDAVVTDHLGDVYWAVGRKMEARFQWRRALSFHPTESDATRITRKLEVGLDQVQQEEKAAPSPAPADSTSPDSTSPGSASPADPAPVTTGNGG
jgi:Flp pilus assembly protein TadD